MGHNVSLDLKKVKDELWLVSVLSQIMQFGLYEIP